MFRQAATSLLNRFRWASQFASFSSRESTITASSKSIWSSRFASEHFRRQPRGFLHIILYGQAALIVGSGSSSVYAEEIANDMTPENDSRASNVGLQRVEDGSVISNEHTSKWRIFTDNGRDFFMQGKLIEAERFFSSALAEARKGFGERDPHVASACNNLAEFYRVTKAYEKAEPLYLDAIKILEESFGPEDVRVGAAFHNMGQFYIVQRKFEQARVSYERALKIKGRVLGHGHTDYAETMFHLGTLLFLQGNLKDAEVLVLDSIRILEEGGQGESHTCIRKLRYLAKIYSKSNDRLEEATNVQKKIFHIMELTKGWDSMDTVIAAESLSMTLQAMGKLREAQELLERCLDVRRTLLPEDHIQIGANMLKLANVALLNSKQLKNSGTSEVIVELDKAKELLTNSTRIAQRVLDSSRKKKKSWKYEQHRGRDEHTALLILLQSRIALANMEIARQKVAGTGEALPAFEAETSLRQCIRAFRQWKNNSFFKLSSESMDEEDIEKAVIAYLKKKGFKQTELAFQEEHQQSKNSSFNSHSNSDFAKLILSSSSDGCPSSMKLKYILKKQFSQNVNCQYGDGIASNSTSVDLKAEYHSCLKMLLNLITKNKEQSRTSEIEELKDEIRHLETEIASRRPPN